MNRPTWVTVEGINGVGKTHLCRRLAQRLGPECRHLSELTDQHTDRLPGHIISAMAAQGDPFLRTGHPRTETLALIALKVREYETVEHTPDPASIVLEDRGIDTVAIYQAAILTEPATAAEQVTRVVQQVYRTASAWRPPPRRTLLLVDELDACLQRFSARIGQTLAEGDRVLIKRIHRLYLEQAAAEPERFAVIDRTERSEADVLDEMEHQCRDLMKEPSCMN